MYWKCLVRGWLPNWSLRKENKCVLQFNRLTHQLWVSQSGRSMTVAIYMPCSVILWCRKAVLLHMEILQHFSGQGEADLAALLTPRHFPQVTQSLSESSWPEDTSSAKIIGLILREITVLNHSPPMVLVCLSVISFWTSAPLWDRGSESVGVHERE